MQYALVRHDGGISILNMIPTYASDGVHVYKIGTIQRRDDGTYTIRLGLTFVSEQPSDPERGTTLAKDPLLAFLQGTAAGIGLIKEPTVVITLTEVTVGWKKEGWGFYFTNPENDIAKWPQAERDKIKEIVAIPEALPHDRLYRNAWCLKGTQVSIDMPKAREIHCDLMRTARTPILKELDVAYIRAVERGDDAEQQRIVAQKQKLRDVTDLPEIAAAAYPDDLKAVWPVELGEHPLMQDAYQQRRVVSDAKLGTLSPVHQAAIRQKR